MRISQNIITIFHEFANSAKRNCLMAVKTVQSIIQTIELRTIIYLYCVCYRENVEGYAHFVLIDNNL